jgi:hypothetical protein
VFERGLVWQRLLGTKTINSADVQSVKHIQHTGRNGNYEEIELELKDGTSYSINGIKEADQLVAYIRAWGRAAAAPVGAPAYAAPAAGGWRPPGT